ncbi:putative PHD type zinc finger protein with BAH domain-containing protein [Apophysomyces ossiformis]|uniref:Putative PHD type zinc finger protein with BAH domain-containing protein n=1 Tax=Apophysomyces ossiformis TaxID=679940 RepID=A0A8H7BHC4_9FUNG|nr:putative PHD type zinc finger protein with BAH domain-containing protein [Apophysomyces ossiformis]
MSDTKSMLAITQAKLNDGVIVAINDHVYLTPEHLGEPYYIGRIMEFCTSPKRKGLQARIAWFNRPKDVINRKSYDPCLLVATMHSDLNPVSSIRGKCVVTHKYYIRQDKLDEYRSQADHFYYSQLYDRYMQRVYDIVPCETVQNVPMEVQEALCQRYQFIVVEQGKASDLTVARRTCCVCQECASSVKCAACQKSFHMSCLNPPLVRKPSKGFAWQCAFCSRKEMLEEPNPVQNLVSNSPPMSTPPATNGTNDIGSARSIKRQTRNATRGQVQKVPTTPAATLKTTEVKLKISQKSNTAQREIRTTNMWPFRYFGINTNTMDILDVDDRIYPRARSRIGARYQANVPDMGDSRSNSSGAEGPSKFSQNSLQKLNGKGRSKRAEKRGRPPAKKRLDAMNGVVPSDVTPDIDSPLHDELKPVRGTDDTVTPIFLPGQIDEVQLDSYIKEAKSISYLPLPFHSVDFLDRALLELQNNNYDITVALQSLSKLEADDFPYLSTWSDEEVAAFEQSIQENGHDLQSIRQRLSTKTMADIVRYFYKWKKTERYEPVYSQWTKIYRPTKKFKKRSSTNKEICNGSPIDDMELESDSESEIATDDPTIISPSTYSKKTYQCMNCLTMESKIWRRSPSDIDRKRKVFRHVLCDECGIFWLKYGKMKPIPESLAAVRGRGRPGKTNGEVAITLRTPGKRKRNIDVPGMKSYPKKSKDDKRSTVLLFAPTDCALCGLMEPETRLLTCYDCGLSVHDDCYGVQKPEKEGWICDVCSNKRNPVASYVYECCVCCEKGQRQVMKRTAEYSWVHLLCALFLPETKFVNTETFSPVEYIATCHFSRWNTTCELCRDISGACITCGECHKAIHLNCAIKNSFKIAFDIQDTKNVKNAVTIPQGLFKDNDPAGLMIPQAWCPEHDLSSRRLIELTERTVEGQESSIYTYAKLYKEVEAGSTPAMRRYRSISRKHPYNQQVYPLGSVSTDLKESKIPTARESVLGILKRTSDWTSRVNLDAPQNTALSGVRKVSCKGTCSECPVKFSPMWYDADPSNPSSGEKICNVCQFYRDHPEEKRDKDELTK